MAEIAFARIFVLLERASSDLPSRLEKSSNKAPPIDASSKVIRCNASLVQKEMEPSGMVRPWFPLSKFLSAFGLKLAKSLMGIFGNNWVKSLIHLV